ncbi:MAG: anti-sigma factor family protein [Persicimonas sp.]
MNCETTRNRLNAYRDEELDPEVQAELESHLEDCLKCRRALERLETVVRQLERATPAPPVPEGFAERVLERAAEENPSGPPRPGPSCRWWSDSTGTARIAAAAVLALGVIIGVLMASGLWSGDDSRPGQISDRTTTETTYGLGHFSEAPDGSLIDAYVALSETPSAPAD